MIELDFFEELILIKQVHQKSVTYVNTDNFKIKVLCGNPML